MSRTFIEGLWDLVFPPLCIHCKKLLSPSDKRWQLCPDCRRLLVANRPPFCLSCSRPLTDLTALFCPTCAHHPRHFDRAWAAAVYTKTMGELLHKFKYGQKTALRHFFFHLMTSFIRTYHLPTAKWDLIIPIPLYPSRKRERGFNQSELLGELLSQSLGISMATSVLKRVRPTIYQAKVTQKERWTNIAGAFRMKSPVAVAGGNILLIDDLLTTGATSSEAARVLKAGGAVSVDVLTLAIATERH